MNVLFILITLSSIVAGGFLIAFIWAVKTGQFDDGHTPAVRILFEDTKVSDTDSNNEEELTENK
ncbi:MAG: cbb3-type cytochrome oxidase assembly protein CcoS [Bacteroidales bacterium]|jgi:cbb3-type cytochrome oxidase maturation protein|nr:cbb3-type cytochrome oxidase assembly protein CcoS [Bacteroidales bacterium]